MEMVQCSLCRRQFPENEVIKTGDYRVCTGCKPLFLQRLREGEPLSGEMVYAGFWIRLGAKLLDGVVLWIVNYLFGILEGFTGGHGGGALSGTLSIVVNIGYATYFVGAYGATLGKMVCGLKVVRPDGGGISYGRAFGRFWAEILSAMILCIGYIMVGFDDEKRALHDRICDTRVVRGNA